MTYIEFRARVSGPAFSGDRIPSQAVPSSKRDDEITMLDGTDADELRTDL